MERYDKLVPFILKFEGGYAEVQGDLGGPTCSGITLNTYRAYYGADKTKEDLKHLTRTEWTHIFKNGFWDKCKCDKINNQSIAYLLCDFAWHSGVKTAVKVIQGLVGVSQDGLIGNQTLNAINSKNGEKLFYRFLKARQEFLYNLISKRPDYQKFELGFMRRLFGLYSLCYS